MWRIRERLYLGDFRSGEWALRGERPPLLKNTPSEPFTGVVSLCPMPLVPWTSVSGESLDPAPTHLQTEWLRMPIADGGKGEDEFERAMSVALPFIVRRQRVGNVMVHCAAGMSRSVSMIAALLCQGGTSVEDAFREIAVAKARALLEDSETPFLIAPAGEFISCLNRRYKRA